MSPQERDNLIERLKEIPTREISEFFTYLEKLNDKNNNNVRMTSAEITEMFVTSEKYYQKREYGAHCSACISRVFRGLNSLGYYMSEEVARRNL